MKDSKETSLIRLYVYFTMRLYVHGVDVSPHIPVIILHISSLDIVACCAPPAIDRRKEKQEQKNCTQLPSIIRLNMSLLDLSLCTERSLCLSVCLSVP